MTMTKDMHSGIEPSDLVFNRGGAGNFREALESEVFSRRQQLGSRKKVRKRDDLTIVGSDVRFVHRDEVLRNLVNRIRPFTEPEIAPPFKMTLLAASLNIKARLVPGEKGHYPHACYLFRTRFDVKVIAQVNDSGELFE
jgi:hypothetical protein